MNLPIMDGNFNKNYRLSEAPEILSVDLKYSAENFKSHEIPLGLFVHFCNTLFHLFHLSYPFCSFNPFNR